MSRIRHQDGERASAGAARLTRELGELREAVVRARSAAAGAGPEALDGVAAALLELYRATGERGLLAEALDTIVSAIGLAAAGDVGRARLLTTQTTLLRERYRFTADLSLLREAAELGRTAVAVAGADRERVVCLSELGETLRILGFATQDPEMADEAVSIARRVLEAPAGRGPDEAGRLDGLGSALWARSWRSRSADDADEAVARGRAALGAASEHDPRLPLYRSGLARSLLRSHQLTAAPEAVGEAADLLRDAAAVLPVAHVGSADLQARLGQALLVLYGLRSERALLAESIAAGRAAVAAAALDDPYREEYLADVSTSLAAFGVDYRDLGAFGEAAAIRRELADALPAGHPDRLERLVRLGNAFGAAYETTNDLDSLHRSIAVHREAISESPFADGEVEAGDGASRATHAASLLVDALDGLALGLRSLSGLNGDSAAVQEAIALRRRALMMLDEEAAGAWNLLDGLTADMKALFAGASSARERRDAVAAQRTLIEADRDSVWYPYRLICLNIGIGDALNRDPDPELLRAMLEASRAAAAATPETHPERGYRQYVLALDLWSLYTETRDVVGLRDCVEAGRLALAATAQDEAAFGQRTINLASDLFVLGIATNDQAVTLEGVETARKALAATAPGSPDLPVRRHLLAACLVVAYEQTGVAALLREAGAGFAAILEEGTDDADIRSLTFEGLSNVRLRTYELTGDAGELEAAIAAGRAAAEASTDPERTAIVHGDLGTLLVRSFETTGDLGSLREAVELGRAAVGGPVEDLDVAAALRAGLANALLRLHIRTGNVAALHEAVSLSRAAVAACSPDHLFRSLCLAALGLCTMELGGRTGDQAVLLEAAEAYRAAADAVGAGHPHRALFLGNLAAVNRLRYHRSGDVSELREAIISSRESVAATPVRHHGMALFLSGLANSLLTLADRTRSAPVTREAVATARAAVAATSVDHFFRAAAMQTLGNALQSLYERTGDLDVAHEAMAVRRATVAELPEGHTWMGVALSGQARTLNHLYSRTGNRAVLSQLVAGARRGLAGIPDGEPRPPMLRFYLASALLYEFEDTGDTAALAAARDLYLEVAQDPNTTVGIVVRAWAARSFTDIAAGDPASARLAAEAAVELLPRSASRALHRRDREVRLGEVNGVGAQAAEAALAAGDPVRALELLEQARGVLLREMMSMRAAPPELRGHSEALAREFEELRDEFAGLAVESDADGEPLPTATAPGQLAGGAVAAVADRGTERWRVQRRREATRRWDVLIDRIRSEPGLSGFMLPRPAEQLQAEVGCAPVVLLTVGSRHGNALILTADRAGPVRAVALPGISTGELSVQVNRFKGALWAAQSEDSSLDAQRRGQRAVLETLGWLWDAVAHPVLTELGYDRLPRPAGPWPRVWWCPTGMLSFLPLHAAGHHRDLGVGAAEPRCVLDRVVSSYTATVHSLSRGAGPRTERAPGGRALIVSVSEAGGAPALGDVGNEAREIAALLPARTVLSEAQASLRNVLDALPGHAVAHFACHGLSDWTSPQDSCLILGGGGADRLSVEAISRLELDADLAFLSACETTDTVPRLADEALHITSAFQLAGYRHVIGTLWPINDSAARVIATDVYRELTAGGTRDAEADGSALALHHAVRRLRGEDDGFLTPTRWAGHIHTGP